MTLEGLTEKITAAFGDDCTAVLQYGGSATSDNVLVILRSLRPAALRAAAAAIKAWQKEGHRAPLILTEAEWRSSRDVFAMEHADIGARHRVLAGALPAVGAPSTDHLRHQLEYEAMGALIHLRQGALVAAGDPSRTLELLTLVKGTVMALLRGLLRVHGDVIPDDAEAVARQGASRAGFDPAALLEILAHAGGTRSIPPARAEEVLDGCHATLKKLVAHVDAMLHPDTPAVD